MNAVGIFTFLLLLAFLSLELSFMGEAGNAFREREEAITLGFESEKASFTRALMEASVDYVLEQVLHEGLEMNLEPEEIKLMANKSLVLLFLEMEETYKEGVKVIFDEKAFNQQYLNENSSVLVQRIGEKTVAAEYTYTGGLLKNSLVKAQVLGKRSRLLFKIPAGYTVKAAVVA